MTIVISPFVHEKFKTIMLSALIIVALVSCSNFERKHQSVISLPLPEHPWLVRSTNVCFKVGEYSNWLGDFDAPLLNLYKFHAESNVKMLGGLDKQSFEILGGGLPIKFLNISSLNMTKKTKFFHGKTVMPDGQWQGHNPAHFIFPIGQLFEWGLDKPISLPTFDRVGLFRVSSWHDYLFEWPWGRIALEAALSKWEEVGLFKTKSKKIRRNITHSISSEHSTHPLPHVYSPSRNVTVTDMYCFEDLFIVKRWGIIMNSSTAASAFRETVNTLLHNQGHDIQKRFKLFLTDATLVDRCREKNIKILIQNRDLGTQRHIANMEDTVSFSKKFTKNVENFQTPNRLEDQIEKYNSFDILVTMAGSHLTNIVFTNRTKVAVVEVGVAIRDWFWKENAIRFGISNYFYSHVGHTPHKKCIDEGRTKDVSQACKVVPNVLDSVVYCKPHLDGNGNPFQWHPYSDCTFNVTEEHYARTLTKAILSICPSYFS